MLIISQETHGRFLAGSSKSFDQKCEEFVLEHFPDLCAMAGQEVTREALDKGIAAAERAGFVRQPDTLRFLYLWFLLGRDFDINPDYRWLSSTMSDRARPPSERISGAMDLVAARLEKDQPLEERQPADRSVQAAAYSENMA